MLSVSSCSKAKNSAEVPLENLRTLPMPEVPESLTTPEERADYVSIHFWDKMDFNNGLLLGDTLFLEQSVVDYLTVLSLASQDAKEHSVSILMRGISDSRTAFLSVTQVLEKYLYEPESPMRDNEMYILFGEHIVLSTLLTPEERVVSEYHLNLAKLNRVGSTANNFNILLRDGTTVTFHDVLKSAPFTLLIFYDPDCELCHKILSDVSGMKLPKNLQLLAVDAEDNKSVWQRDAKMLPAQWSVGFDLTSVIDNNLYEIQATPTLYLLSSDATVILKDFPPEHLPNVIAGVSDAM